MSSYKIISDTASDIYPSVIDTETIPRVPFYVTFDKENYQREIAEISVDEFYRRISEDKVFPKTSCPTRADYITAFEPVLEGGQDILCFCISSLFSGSYQSAVNAADMMEDKYPDRKIKIIDSIQAGYTLEENISVIERLKHDTAINWTVGSLDFLQNGGRIGKTAALAGTIFNVKPIICMKEGELFPVENVRGTKKAVKTIIEKTDKEISGHEDEYIITMFYADESVPIMDTIAEHYSRNNYCFIENMCRVGVTIGSHTGPHVIAIAYSKKYELYDK